MPAVNRVAYAGWEGCYRLANGVVDLVVTAEVGPRIIRFGFVEGPNEFAEFPDDLGRTGGEQWRIYGGHRLWHAPEAAPRTYHPDNQPVAVHEQDGGLLVSQPAEPSTGLSKQMAIRLAEEGASVQVVHRLRNEGLWPIEFAPWALSVMAPGGVAVVPLPPRGSHPEDLLPTSRLILWAYTDMSDPRWGWGRRYTLLRQDAAASRPQKAGFHCTDGWAAYARGGHLFVKRFHYDPAARYPDLGATVETFTDGSMLEVETLGPLVRVEPGDSVEHVETWHLFEGVPPPAGDADVDAHITPRVEAASWPGAW